jgi:acetoin utilization deacetylase AcuC-like enzyme
VRLYYADTFVLPLPAGHRFPMAKYSRLRERVAESLELAAATLHIPPAATDEELRQAHDEGYVARVLGGHLEPREVRRIGFPFSQQMVERSRRSVGGTLAASRAALDEGVAGNLAGGTHHAGRDFGEGYCVFNDVAVSARVLLHERRVSRVAVIDGDVHQGNGTAAILGRDERCFTFSVHGARNFPFRKVPGHLDVALHDGAGDEPYLEAIATGLQAALDDFGAELVLFVAGADPWEGDVLGHLAVTKEGLLARDELVFERCEARGVPVCVCMGGGYAPDVEDCVELHYQTFAAAMRSFLRRRATSTRRAS